MFTSGYAIYGSNERERQYYSYGLPSISEFSEEEFDASFPYALWQIQLSKYKHYWYLYEGRYLQETVQGAAHPDGRPVLKYPLAINHLSATCQKRNYILWGEKSDKVSGPVSISVQSKVADITDKTRKSEMQNFINEVWEQNNDAALLSEAGLIQQILGGVFIRVCFDPTDPDLYHQIRLETVLPDFVLPVWDASHPDKLLEVYFIKRMLRREAQIKFNYRDDGGQTDPVYVEHWQQDRVHITLNRKPISVTVNDIEIVYDNAPNPYGFVPFQYIPTERAGGFYGVSALEGLENLSREINLRLADLGDAVQDSSHRLYWTRNVQRGTETRDIGGNRAAIDLGLTPTVSNDPPEIGAIDPPNIPTGISGFPDMLMSEFERSAFVPPVADGVDEGSQRSALTLHFRLLPLSSKVRTMRYYWQVALINIAKMIIRVGRTHGACDFTENDLRTSVLRCNWSPMLPRDQEAELNKAILALQTNILSPTSAIHMLDLASDADEEYKNIQRHLEWMAQLKPETGDVGDIGKPSIETETPVASSKTSNK